MIPEFIRGTKFTSDFHTIPEFNKIQLGLDAITSNDRKEVSSYENLIISFPSRNIPGNIVFD